MRYEKILTHNSGEKGKRRKAARNLTSQHLIDRLNDSNEK
jgi:hypothetical protein